MLGAMTQHVMRIWGWILLVAVAGMALPYEAWASARKKGPKIVVRFHLLTNETDSEKFAVAMQMLDSGKLVYVSRSPALSEQDILSSYPFEADDGTWGVAFYLNNHGRIVLDALSIERRGSYVVAMVGMRHVADLFIDRRVSDGIITIPSGLTRPEVDLIVQEFGVYGETRKGGRT